MAVFFYFWKVFLLGKAVPKNVKSKANELVKAFPGKFSEDFNVNKRIVTDELKIPLAKEQRNLVAGFITRKIIKLKAA
ncbi:30S ribosomal protein S17e [uncultured archaeon]|nr:30S ribosomal protein S17e [uncultured archaeon]